VVKNGTTINYKYDGLGRRVEKEINDGVTTKVNRFIYDNEDILLELDGSNNITARYTHGPGIDEPLIMERSGVSFFYHVDGLGSVTEITDTLGAVKQQYTYSSFGKIESQLDPNFVQLYTFTSREFDPETGLYFYRARYYEASTARFLQQDPIGLAGGINVYAYVNANPINSGDPFGLFSTVDFVWHYFRGGGAPIDLAQVGLTNAFRNTPSVSSAVSQFKNITDLVAKVKAVSSCQECNQGSKSFQFTREDRTVTNVTFEPNLFSVGRSTFFRSASCSGVSDCSSRTYSYFCNFSFSIRDKFVDPINLGIEILGATPFPITADWLEGVSGSGSF